MVQGFAHMQILLEKALHANARPANPRSCKFEPSSRKSDSTLRLGRSQYLYCESIRVVSSPLLRHFAVPLRLPRQHGSTCSSSFAIHAKALPGATREHIDIHLFRLYLAPVTPIDCTSYRGTIQGVSSPRNWEHFQSSLCSLACHNVTSFTWRL